jgi:hypothetical protein
MNAVSRRQKRPLIGPTIGVGLAVFFLAAGLAGPAVAEGPLGGLAPLGAVSPFFGDEVVVGGGYPFKASTPGESFARGAADVIRAQGEFNRLTSEAAINATEARARAIVNAQEGVKAYFNMRQLNRDYRRAERGPRATQEDYERYARSARPVPLSPSELDTLSGRVNWPILLRDERFAPLRTELEELLDRWAVSRNLGQLDSFGTEEHLAVRRTAEQLTAELREEIRDLPPQDYTAAKRFLRSLEYQVLRPSTSGVSLATLR